MPVHRGNNFFGVLCRPHAVHCKPYLSLVDPLCVRRMEPGDGWDDLRGQSKRALGTMGQTVGGVSNSPEQKMEMSRLRLVSLTLANTTCVTTWPARSLGKQSSCRSLQVKKPLGGVWCAELCASLRGETCRYELCEPRCAQPVVRFSIVLNNSYISIAIAPTTTSPEKARPICMAEPAEISR